MAVTRVVERAAGSTEMAAREAEAMVAAARAALEAWAAEQNLACRK